MLNYKISIATLKDLPTIQGIAKKTFIEAFGPDNTQKNMAIYVANSFNTTKLTAEIKHPNSVFYLATLGEKAIGYIKLNVGDAQTEAIKGNCMELERIYVDSAYHGQGLGQLLMEKSIQIAQAAQKDFLWLGVWEKNPRAIRFYQKNGFEKFDTHVFLMVDDPQTDWMMKKMLRKEVRGQTEKYSESLRNCQM